MHILCPHCRNPIEVVKISSREEIACPSCGSSFHVETESTSDWQPQNGQTLGKFELLETVGHGAFGTVYKARDPELDRTVAVKVPRAGNLAKQDDLDRFVREARSVAQLRHSSIVTVHEVGQSDAMPFLVSDFVEGLTLTDVLSARQPSPREAAEMIAAVAEALHYAHEQGVIHRDIKPSNIMIGEDGAPHVMDFGLAKRDAGEITMTIDGQILGTPAYMSPEQAKGEAHKVDGRSDVYSLGVVLYQMLTGELPFRGTTRMLLHQVLHDEPRPPRKLNDRIARDLETVCLKAMAKEPGRRYATAQALAGDLRCWLNDKPIQARSVGSFERAWRWCRRYPAVASLLALVFVVLIAGFSVSTAFYFRAERNFVKAQEQAGKNLQLANEKDKLAGEKAALAEKEGKEKDKYIRLGYLSDMRLAFADWKTSNVQRMRSLLAKHGPKRGYKQDLRGFEWYYLNNLTDPYLLKIKEPARIVAISPDGNLVAGTQGRAGVTVRDAGSGALKYILKPKGSATCVVFHPNGEDIITGSSEYFGRGREEGYLTVWDAVNGDMKHTITVPKDLITCLKIDATGKYIVCGAGKNHFIRELPPARPWSPSVTVVDLAKRKLVWSNNKTRRVLSVAIRPESNHVLYGTGEGEIVILDAASGKEVRSFKAHRDWINGIAFSPDGKWFVTACGDTTLKMWDFETGKKMHTLTGHGYVVWSVDVSPDGKWIISGAGYSQPGGEGQVKVWDAANGREVYRQPKYTSPVTSVAFSRNGKRIVTGSREVTVWNGDDNGNPEVFTSSIPADAFIFKQRPYDDRPEIKLALSQDGKPVAYRIFAPEKKSKVYDVLSGQFIRRLEPQEFRISHRKTLVRKSNQLEIRDIKSGQTIRTVQLLPKSTALADGACGISQNGKWIVASSPPRTQIPRRLLPGKAQQPLPGKKQKGFGGGFGGGIGGGIGGQPQPPLPGPLPVHAKAVQSRFQVWNAHTGELVLEQQGIDYGIYGLAISPDGKRVLTRPPDAVGSDMSKGPDKRLKHHPELWDIPSGQKVGVLQGDTQVMNSWAFSPDGREIAASMGMFTKSRIVIWDAHTGKRKRELEGHTSSVDCFAYSPDSQRIVSGGPDKTVRVWDTRTGEEILTLKGHIGAITDVMFGPKGRQILSCCNGYHQTGGSTAKRDPQVKVWNLSKNSRITVKGRKIDPNINSRKSRPVFPDPKLVKPDPKEVTDPKKVQAVLTKIYQGYGGKDKLKKLTSWVTKQTSVDNRFNKRITQTYVLLPDKLRSEDIETVNGKEQRFVTIVNGNQTWSDHPRRRRFQPANPANVFFFQRVIAMQPRIDLALENPLAKLSLLPETTIDGEAVIVIKSRNPKLLRAYRRFLFHKPSGRLLRTEFVSRFSTVQTNYREYKEVAGIPYAQKLTRSGATITQEIHVAEKLDPKLFERPAEKKD